MSTIRCVYHEEPNFPATDQHPDAARYQVGKYYVDAIGGEPSQDDIDAVINPAAKEPSAFDVLVSKLKNNPEAVAAIEQAFKL